MFELDMAETVLKKAFWHAVLTVVPAALVAAGVIFCLVGFQEWAACIILVVVPALILLPLVSARYREGPRPEPTPKELRKRAMLWSFLSFMYILAILVDHKTGWNAVLKWAIALAWLVGAL